MGHPHGLLVRGCECRPAASGTPEIIEYAIQRSSTDSLFFHDHDIVILLYWPSMFVWSLVQPRHSFDSRGWGGIRMQIDAPALSVSECDAVPGAETSIRHSRPCVPFFGKIILTLYNSYLTPTTITTTDSARDTYAHWLLRTSVATKQNKSLSICTCM